MDAVSPLALPRISCPFPGIDKVKGLYQNRKTVAAERLLHCYGEQCIVCLFCEIVLVSTDAAWEYTLLSGTTAADTAAELGCSKSAACVL